MRWCTGAGLADLSPRAPVWSRPGPGVPGTYRWYGTRFPLAGPRHRLSALCLTPAPPAVPQSRGFPSGFPRLRNFPLAAVPPPSAPAATLCQGRDRAEGFPGERGKAGVGREKKGGKKPPWLLPESETNKLGQQNINLADRNGIDLHSQLFFPLIYELPSLKDYSNHGRTV